MNNQITVEVAYARPECQKILTVVVPEGTTLLQAALQSDICKYFPEIVLTEAKMGVFGKLSVNPVTQIIHAGERIEIYRPLIADPKEMRKRRAEQNKFLKELNEHSVR